MQKKTLNKLIRYVDSTEMTEIKSNKKLLKKLKAGHRDAKTMKGKFVEFKSPKISHS